MLNQVSVDKDLLKQKYNTKIVKKQEQLSREFKDKWKVQENEFEVCMIFFIKFFKYVIIYHFLVSLYYLNILVQKLYVLCQRLLLKDKNSSSI